MFTRRQLLARMGTGLGLLGLAGVISEQGLRAEEAGPLANPLAPKAPHFPPRARHIIHLYMNGGPSQVDTFDPKPALARYQGQRPASTVRLRTENGTGGLRPSPFKFERRARSGLEFSELFTEVGRFA